MGEIHDKNVEELSLACGQIVAVQEKKCRMLPEIYHDQMEERNARDGKCEKAYDDFETTCKSKAGDLEKIYKLQVQTMAAKQKCYGDWCPEFPTVYTMDGADAQNAEVEKRCKPRCRRSA